MSDLYSKCLPDSNTFCRLYWQNEGWKENPFACRIADVLSASEGIRGLERAGVFENNNLFPLQDSALSFAMRQPDF